ncbi:MAG: hypothetical protein DI613_16515, partial [Kocuria rhizophila]
MRSKPDNKQLIALVLHIADGLHAQELDEQQRRIVRLEHGRELGGEFLTEGGVAHDVAGPGLRPLEKHVH